MSNYLREMEESYIRSVFYADFGTLPTEPIESQNKPLQGLQTKGYEPTKYHDFLEGHGVPHEVSSHYDKLFQDAVKPVIQRTGHPEILSGLHTLHNEGLKAGNERLGFTGYLGKMIVGNNLHNKGYEVDSVLHHLAHDVLSNKTRTGKDRKTPFDKIGEPLSPEHTDAYIKQALNYSMKNVVSPRKGKSLKGLANTGQLSEDQQKQAPSYQPEVPSISQLLSSGQRQLRGESWVSSGNEKDMRKTFFDKHGYHYPLEVNKQPEFVELLHKIGQENGLPLVNAYNYLREGGHGSSKELLKKYGDWTYKAITRSINDAYEDYTGSAPGDIRNSIFKAIKDTHPIPRRKMTPEESERYDRNLLLGYIGNLAERNKQATKDDLSGLVLRRLPPSNKESGHKNRLHELIDQLTKEGLVKVSGNENNPWLLGPGENFYKK